MSDIQTSADSKSVWIRYNDLGIARIAEVDLKGKLKQADVVLGAQHWDALATARSRSGVKTVLPTLGRDDRPADLALVQSGKQPLQLTDPNSDHMGQREMSRLSAWSGLPRRTRNRRLGKATRL